MNGKIKEAFIQVQAEEALKSRTKAFLAQKTRGYTKPAKRPSRSLCMLSAFSDWRTLALFYAYIRNQHRDKTII